MPPPWRRFILKFKKGWPATLKHILHECQKLTKSRGRTRCFSRITSNFGVKVLTEIGAGNMSPVEHLLDDYEFLYTLPKSNMYSGVGLYLSKDITNVNILNSTCICKFCHNSICDFESILISFEFQRNEFILGWLYRQPNGNMQHFVDDLERTLVTINGKASCLLAGVWILIW